MKRQIIFYARALGMASLVLLSACVTQKRKDDISGLSKVYHNTTAKYNGYFNAREIMELTLLELEQRHQDNYQQGVVFFPYMALKDPKQIYPQMDTAIQKVTRVVALHPRSQWTDDCYLLVGQAQFLKKDYEAAEETLRFMVAEFDPERPANRKSRIGEATAKNDPRARAAAAAAKMKERKELQKAREKAAKQKQKEREKAAKEMAKKRKRYNKDVARARKKGTTVSRPSPYAKPKPGAPAPVEEQDPKKLAEAAKKKAKEEEAKRKEEEKKQQPDNYFLKHKPAYQFGVLWLARTLIERDNPESAMRLLTKLLENSKTLPEVRQEIWPVLAYLYVKREQPDEAVMPLEQAIASNIPRSQKGRYAFILAQLHETAGRWQQAGKAYNQAISYAASYDMEFRARLNMALNNYRGSVSTLADTRSELDRMLRDPKNAGFEDQIYYTLATLALDNKDQEAAIENLRLSLANSTNNPIQKAETYFTLAQLYLKSENYLQAKLYFDSTLMSMSPQDNRVAEVKRWQSSLQDIAEYITQINGMDTLLKMSYLSDDERRKLASSIKKAEDEKRLAEIAARQAPPAALPTTARREIGAPPLNQADLQSTFFAYNERNLKRGEREFFAKWGSTRVLEDDWRRSARKSAAEVAAVENAGAAPRAQDKAGDLLLTPEEIDQILGKVPKNEGDRRLLEYKLSEAMFKLGALYRERLDNNKKTIEVLEELQRRFPRNNFELDTWYYLYLGYTELGNRLKAQEYAEKLKDKYPSSKYALVIANPDYLKELTDKETEINRYYDRAYLAFKEEKYEEALQMCNDSRPRFGAENPLRARFAMLSAFCTGKLQGKEAYQAALSEVVAKFPDTEEQKQAREILRILGGATASLPGGQKEEVAAEDVSGFTMEENQLYYILVAGNEKMNINDAKNAVSDYNRKYHQLEKLSLTNMFIGPDEKNRTPLIIIRRFNNRAEAMKYYQSVVSSKEQFIPGMEFDVMAISLNNYRELIRQQSVAAYQQFFKANYR